MCHSVIYEASQLHATTTSSYCTTTSSRRTLGSEKRSKRHTLREENIAKECGKKMRN